MTRWTLIAGGSLALIAATAAAQQPGAVVTSGKSATDLKDVPPAVLAAVQAAQPSMKIEEAASEMRDGRNYFDVEGTLPDGSEIELDLMQDASGWNVVETQRDIAFAAAPEMVRAAAARADAAFRPARVIESRQNDGVIIYELFGPPPAKGDPRKIEVKYDGRTAEVLTEEWAH